MNASAIDALPSFALLGPGFTGRGFVLVAPLVPVTAAARVVFAPYGPPAPCGWSGEVRTLPGGPALDVAAARLAPRLDERGHAAAIERVRAAIARGDVYQVNVTLRAALGDVPAPALYARLAPEARFAAWVRLPDGVEFVSASPELFFEVDGSRVRSEPMKGTCRAGDETVLEASAKDRAELAMITDLVRNDLTPVSVPRSVRVVNARRLIRLRYAVQAVSDVESTLLPGLGPLDVLTALHPGGSVTGAPKPVAVRMIEELEATPRGPYCGTVGFIDGSRATFSLLIRTAWRTHGGPWTYGAGGGIVWESDAARELDEVRVKLGALRG